MDKFSLVPPAKDPNRDGTSSVVACLDVLGAEIDGFEKKTIL